MLNARLFADELLLLVDRLDPPGNIYRLPQVSSRTAAVTRAFADHRLPVTRG